MKASKTSIAKKMIMWVVISSILIASIISFFYLQNDYKKQLVSVKNQLVDIEKGYMDALASSIYAEDEEQTLNAINGILKLPDMVQVSIFSEDDQDAMFTNVNDKYKKFQPDI